GRRLRLWRPAHHPRGLVGQAAPARAFEAPKIQIYCPRQAGNRGDRSAETSVRGFIFDLDGVLTDTAEFHYRAWQRLADEEGLPFSRLANEKLRGGAGRERLMLIAGQRTYSEEQIQSMMERKNSYYLQAIETITPNDLLP